ncbi:MAG: transglutaminase domain-containing protein [Sphingobacteriales bacterium]|nr:transglutaminase domain-containing protein [Sphingobacteriales bacterium]
MKINSKLLLGVFILLSAGNVLIFIYRNNGFEYVKYSDLQELYPENPDTSFLTEWNSYNKRWGDSEIKKGLILLKNHTGIDTVSNERDEIINIAVWLHKSFSHQAGTPDSFISKLTPLQQYEYLKTGREKKLWCGQFQAMFGFFCTVAGFKNRYVEIVPVKNDLNTGYHEVNEVYLPLEKRWVMVDVSRNNFLIKRDDQFFSAAGYLNYWLKGKPENLFVTSLSGDSVQTLSQSPEKQLQDIYFNKSHYLRYYYSMSLSETYSLAKKIKRYVLSSPWYEVYGPQLSHSNFLFRVKQFFFFAFAALLPLMLYIFLKPKRNSNGQKTG